jgi:hypothetical protein
MLHEAREGARRETRVMMCCWELCREGAPRETRMMMCWELCREGAPRETRVVMCCWELCREGAPRETRVMMCCWELCREELIWEYVGMYVDLHIYSSIKLWIPFVCYVVICIYDTQLCKHVMT